MADLLDDDAIAAALTDLPGWERSGTTAITRTAKLPDFPTAIAAVDEVAEIAEQDAHHPDIDIRHTSLTFTLSTHSEGGLTSKDTALAAKISSVIAGRSG